MLATEHLWGLKLPPRSVVRRHLFEIEVEVVSITVLEHGAEGVGVDLEDVEEGDDAGVLKILVDVVFAERVLDVVGLLVVLPVLVQLMNLASDVALLLGIETLVDLDI